MDHLLVKLPELCQHRLVLFIIKVGPTCGEKDFVLLLNVLGVKLNNGAKFAGNVRQSGYEQYSGMRRCR